MSCPCGGTKSTNWHYRHVPKLKVCTPALEYRRQRDKDYRAKTRPPKAPEPECPCDGTKRRDWHRSRGLPLCKTGRDAIYAQQNPDTYIHREDGKKYTWTAGSGIDIPEFDPL